MKPFKALFAIMFTVGMSFFFALPAAAVDLSCEGDSLICQEKEAYLNASPGNGYENGPSVDDIAVKNGAVPSEPSSMDGDDDIAVENGAVPSEPSAAPGSDFPAYSDDVPA